MCLKLELIEPAVQSGRGRSAASYSRLDLGACVPILQHDFGCDDRLFGGERPWEARPPRPRWRVCEVIADRAERLVQSNGASEKGVWRSVNYPPSSDG
jgi:hypothetical protein